MSFNNNVKYYYYNSLHVKNISYTWKITQYVNITLEDLRFKYIHNYTMFLFFYIYFNNLSGINLHIFYYQVYLFKNYIIRSFLYHQ